MNRLLIIVLLIAGGCSTGPESMKECTSARNFRAAANPSFTTMVMNVRSGAGSRIDLYVQMPFDHLRFERAMDLFKGSYSVLFVVRDSAGAVVTTREVERPVTARSYQESVSSRFDMHLQSFLLQPGNYSVEIVTTDRLSKLRFRTIERIRAERFDPGTTAVSSMMFLEHAGADGNSVTVRPIMPASIAFLNDSVGTFQEVYRGAVEDSILITDRYLRIPVSGELQDSAVVPLPPYSTLRCSDDADSVLFRTDTVLTERIPGDGTFLRFLPLPPVGATEYRREAIVLRRGERDTVRTVHRIFRRDPRFRNGPAMDEITAAIRYIARQEEYDSLRMLTGESRALRLASFWAVRGGRERRMEFERRILEANALFTTCVDGSRTAMGIVYIICGVPDGIDCRGAYSETWYYTIGERTYAMEFRRDVAGARTFELTPFSVNESVWQYFVERWRRWS